MAQTPDTSLTGYCTPAQALTFCDYRPLADLCSTDEIRLSLSALQVSPIFINALLAASGVVESAASLGGRYVPADLAALTGSGQALLQWMVAKIAEGNLIGLRMDKGYDIPAAYTAITANGGWLDKLASGERIFPFQETQDAGRMHEQEVVESEVTARNLATTQARRYWGARAQDWQ